MRALVYSAPDEAAVVDTLDPAFGETDCLVRMRRVGICHSDFDLLAGKYILPIEYPIIPGHEWTGEIVAVGAAVTGFAVGDRVVGECSVADDQHFGFTIDGAIADLVRVPQAWLHKLPDSIDDTMGALVEPFTVAYGATDEIDGSDDVVVFGGGPIGLCAVASAHAKGGRVILVEPDAARREIGLSLGADVVVDPIGIDVVARILELTDGRGASRIVEATGRPAVMAQTLEAAAYGAYITNIGINVGDEHPARLGLIVEKMLRIRGQVGSVGVWPQAIKFLGHTGIDLTPLVSQVFPLDEALTALAESSKRDVNIKIHIRPNDGADATWT
ncbi:zinc-dependent alcohol dehydrogenase [Microbacterium sp. No. 7]|uniref:zinc-dependent alcohol dehydrogenase n=1 Tax=Microbacterium sp. No. 7 TaxID=1714373 RepID=UPI0006D2BECB|nr:zinc-binding dehydrogenase [Microbacterium sp. No. 7]ALJ21761.1 alcohol dehydrogenase [Microbacterium sp. No. 7]